MNLQFLLHRLQISFHFIDESSDQSVSVRHPSSDDSDPLSHVSDDTTDKGIREKEDGKKIVTQIAIMEPILRFLQLLCENHNRDLQVIISQAF